MKVHLSNCNGEPELARIQPVWRRMGSSLSLLFQMVALCKRRFSTMMHRYQHQSFERAFEAWVDASVVTLRKIFDLFFFAINKQYLTSRKSRFIGIHEKKNGKNWYIYSVNVNYLGASAATAPNSKPKRDDFLHVVVVVVVIRGGAHRRFESGRSLPNNNVYVWCML